MELEYSKSYFPIQENELIAVENKLGFCFPNDYRSFLLQQNGGKPKKSLIFPVLTFGQDVTLNSFYGIGEKTYKGMTLVGAYEIFKDRIPFGFSPIGDNGSGDEILLATPLSGIVGVYFFDHENEPYDNSHLRWNEYGNIYKVVDSFTAFLNCLKEWSDGE
jgi:hypothetical protein